jgi:hypothetical protein
MGKGTAAAGPASSGDITPSALSVSDVLATKHRETWGLHLVPIKSPLVEVLQTTGSADQVKRAGGAPMGIAITSSSQQPSTSNEPRGPRLFRHPPPPATTPPPAPAATSHRHPGRSRGQGLQGTSGGARRRRHSCWQLAPSATASHHQPQPPAPLNTTSHPPPASHHTPPLVLVRHQRP